MARCDFLDELLSLKDEKYREFHSKLIPTVERERIIGVRMPKLRKLAKDIAGENPDGAKGQPYTLRFAIVCMLQFLLDEAFVKNDLYYLAQIKSEEYYVNMALAWYYSIALVKHYDDTVEILENGILYPWVHNKAIQKAIESYRLTNERKAYLRSLKVK